MYVITYGEIIDEVGTMHTSQIAKYGLFDVAI